MNVARTPSRWNPPRACVMNRLRVVLVNPPPLAVVEPWYDRPDWGRVALAYLASWLQRESAVEVFVVDAKLERLDFEQVQSRVAELAADVVGLTAFTNEIKPAAYTASLVKDVLPHAVTVIGGVHVTQSGFVYGVTIFAGRTWASRPAQGLGSSVFTSKNCRT